MRRVFGQHGFFGRHPIVLLTGAAVFFFCMIPRAAVADDVTGYLDLTYFHSQGNSSSTLGQATTTESEGFRQQYGLTLNRAFYPNLHLLASGIFERTRANVTQNSIDMTAISTISQPYVDLTFRDPFFTFGGSYFEQETRNENVGVSTTTLFNRTYQSIFALRPEALPTIDLRWKDTNVFDRHRTSQDVTDELLSFFTTYEPVRSLRLRYASSRDDLEDKLQGTEVRTTTDNTRVNYDAGLLNNRFIVSANYQNNRQETELLKSSTGVLSVQQFAVSGLASIDATPVNGALDPNLALVDAVTEVGSGITIGLPVTVAGPRNIGLDFGSPKTVNRLSLWVIWNNALLPVEIADTFSWAVYTSTDNLNWTLQTTVAQAAFSAANNRFDIPVPGLTARYIKVVADPLTPAEATASLTFSTAADQQIYVTELQAFTDVMAAGGGAVVASTQIVDGSVKVRLTDTPLLFYDFTYYSSIAEGFTTARTTSITNGLSLSHRFSEVFSGSSRLLHGDDTSPEGETVSYRLNVTVTAAPLRMLNHTLTYNYADIRGPQEDAKRNSWYLTNIATLYRGVDANLSGGVSTQTGSTGMRQDSTTVMFGATVAPRANLSINPSYSAIVAEQSGGGLPDSVNATRTKDLSVVYVPVPAVYLSGSWGSVTQSGRQDRLRNFGASWSPFPGGALQISVTYTENWRSTDNNVTTFLTETARWNITSKTFLMLSHYDTKTTSTTLTSEGTGYTAELRYAF